ncbi:signal peptidase II [Chlamydiifrater phoenicopteri]|uniref:signal peptidase II n=1 Tax=Chlamydiifrater phoenicopteri TaxID=2681469 RepID=UPI001BCCFDEA|nr:signal peptidase II [Chlamydiifrater phoenicopteri]
MKKNSKLERNLLVFLLFPMFVVCMLMIDWGSKFWVLYSQQQYKPLFGFFQKPLYTLALGNFTLEITPTFNEGAAFGILSSHTHLLLALRMAIVVGVSAYIVSRRHLASGANLIGLICILSGAVGNIVDLVYYGKVIDFISLNYGQTLRFPVFNFADMLISFGTFILAVKLCFFPGKQKKINA